MRDMPDVRGLLAWLGSHWRALRNPSRVDADMHDEMRLHIEMDAERRMRQGLDAREAHRQAAMAFGGIETWRGASRDALGFTWARGLSIDLKLGSRMLANIRASRSSPCSRCRSRSARAPAISNSSTI